MVLAAVAAAAPLPAPAAGGATARLPRAGVLVPGTSLGGLRLGMSASRVRALLGGNFGRCRSCAWETWYYGYRPFTPAGLAVELRGRRVAAVFTMWSPSRWRSPEGLVLGDPAEQVTATYGPLTRRSCTGYDVLVLPGTGATTAFMVVDERLWGFILAGPRAPLCR